MFERGWLSANGVLFQGRAGTALVDSGYATHSDQTLALVRQALSGGELDLLLNTHLHSDHCGGNASLQRAYPRLRTRIPAGQAELVREWDAVGLTYEPTGQLCRRFSIDGVLQPGESVDLGDASWQVLGAPGHDPHSIILFEPLSRTLISADALWRNGFGVVFPELEGEQAFEEVERTLDLIESLAPRVVVPGHGSVFSGDQAVREALMVARRRLSSFMGDRVRHATHAGKVLMKFKLLEWQRVSFHDLQSWSSNTAYLRAIAETHFSDMAFERWVTWIVDELIRAGAAERTGEFVSNR